MGLGEEGGRGDGGGERRSRRKQIISCLQSAQGLYEHRPQGNLASADPWRSALGGRGGTGGVVADFQRDEMSAILMGTLKPPGMRD